MSYGKKQIEKFNPQWKANESSITNPKLSDQKADEIFEKQKRLRDALIDLLHTCYEDIHKTADQRQKEQIKFNDKYLTETIVESLQSRDKETIQRGIENVIVDNFSELNIIDQVKLKKYVIDLLEKEISEAHKNNDKEELVVEDNTDSDNESKLSDGSNERCTKTIDKDTTLNIFKDILKNKKIMKNIVDKIGCNIVNSQEKYNRKTIYEINSIRKQSPQQKNKDIRLRRNSVFSLTRSLKRDKTEENKRSRFKGFNIIKPITGFKNAVQRKYTQIKTNSYLFFKRNITKAKTKTYNFFNKRIRNTKAFVKKTKRRIRFFSRRFRLKKDETKKTKKEKFLERYNGIVLKKLYNRIDEFDKATIISKPKKASILKTLGGGIKSFIGWIGKGIFNLVKFTFRSLWKVTKKIFGLIKVGVGAIVSKLKWFLFTPAGAYITGFISGMIWYGLIDPAIQWVKGIIKKFLNMLGFNSVEDLAAQKEKIFNRLRAEYTNFITNNSVGIAQADRILGDMELLAAKLDSFEARIQTLKEDTVGTVINTACTTVGIIVGSFFGPVGALIGGALGKAVGMTAEYFYKQIPDDNSEEVEKNLIIKGMRQRYEKYSPEGAKSNAERERSKLLEKADKEQEEQEKKIKDIEYKLQDKSLGEQQRIALLKKKKEEQQKLQEIQQERNDIIQFGNDETSEESEIMKKLDKMYDIVKKDINYFNTDRLDFKDEFTNGMNKPNPTKGDRRKQLLHDIKKQAFLEAYNLTVRGIISPSLCYNLAENKLKYVLYKPRNITLFGNNTNIQQILQNKVDIDYDDIDYNELELYKDEHAYEGDVIVYTQNIKKRMKEQLLSNKELQKKLGTHQMGLTGEDIDSILNSNYATSKIWEYALQFDMSSRMDTSNRKLIGMVEEIIGRYINVIGSSKLKQEGNKSIADKKVEKKLGIFSGTLDMIGSAIYLTEKDPARRLALNKDKEAALQKYAKLAQQNEKERSEITQKAYDKLQKDKEQIRGEIDNLELEKDRLRQLPDKKDIALIGVEKNEKDIETNPNEENERKNRGSAL